MDADMTWSSGSPSAANCHELEGPWEASHGDYYELISCPKNLLLAPSETGYWARCIADLSQHVYPNVYTARPLTDLLCPKGTRPAQVLSWLWFRPTRYRPDLKAGSSPPRRWSQNLRSGDWHIFQASVPGRPSEGELSLREFFIDWEKKKKQKPWKNKCCNLF